MAKTLHTILMAPFGMDNNSILQAINPENANYDYKEYIGLFQDCTSLEDIGRKLTEMLEKSACIAKYANAVMATIKQKPDAFAHLPKDIIKACAGKEYTAEIVSALNVKEAFPALLNQRNATQAFADVIRNELKKQL